MIPDARNVAASWIDSHAATSMSPLAHYIIVRDDLSLGMTAAQVCHAAGESVRSRVPTGTHAVILGVPAAELPAVAERLVRANAHYKLIFENDAPYALQLMAIGIEPGPKDEVGRILADLPLLRKGGKAT